MYLILVTTDVQPLIDPMSGETIFIDMTETAILSTSPYSPSFIRTSPMNLSSMDKTRISSFINEVFSLIPELYHKIAATAATELLKSSEQQDITEQVSQETRDKYYAYLENILDLYI